MQKTRPDIVLRVLLAGLLITAGLLAVRHGAALLTSWWVMASYPFGVDYGEGIVWQQMLNIFAGQGYAPLGVYPGIVYHYPPVYHLVVGAITTTFGSDPLMTGRLVSAGSTLISAGFVGAIAADVIATTKARTIKSLCAIAAVLAFLASDPIIDWAALMRVDMLACALSLAGLWAALRATKRPGWVHVASICFVLATYTKQVGIAAPLAGIVGLAIGHRRIAIICLIETAALGLMTLGALEMMTGGGFLRHVVLYNVNRTDWHMIAGLIFPIRTHIILIALAVLGAADLARRRDVDRAATAPILLIFTAVKTVMLAMIMKSGANLNYTIEWFAMIAIFAGAALAPVLAYIFGKEPCSPNPARLILTGLLLAQISWLPMPHASIAEAEEIAANRAPLVALIRNAKQPVISDDMTMLLRAGQPVRWEPAIVAELAQFHRYDEPAFIRLIRARRFAFFVTEGARGQHMFDSRYNPPVVDAMDSAYPRQQEIAGYTIHFPPAP